jgi:hypothetical protein
MALQRPLTRKEFIIQSLLTWREPAATLVDTDDQEPTLRMRRPDREPSRPSTPSCVFDLTVVPA